MAEPLVLLPDLMCDARLFGLVGGEHGLLREGFEPVLERVLGVAINLTATPPRCDVREGG